MKELDDVFELLNRERRRYALYYLSEADGPVRVEELAEQVAAWENGSPTEDLPDESFDDVTLTLAHTHLPKAARAEFVEYDRQESVVRLSGSPAEFDVVLSVAKALDRPAVDEGIVGLGDFV